MKGQKFIPLVVVAVGLLAYHNSFTGPFIFDDVLSISENPTIWHLWPIWQPLSPPHHGAITVEGRPLINLSLAINHALGGYNVWGYHALNLVVHILAGLTLLGIVRRTLLQPKLRGRFGEAALPLALVTAILWTVHPLQTESVTYVVQRAESIMGLFYLLTLYYFIRGAESHRPGFWYGLSWAACALGMASKNVMVSAPLMVLLYDRAFLSGSFREAWRRRWPLYLGLSTTWILLGFLQVSAGVFAYASIWAQGVGRWQYLATESGVILHYLRLAFWPRPLCFDYGGQYGWPIAQTVESALPELIVVGALLATTVWAWRRQPVLGFLGMWFFIILAPTSSFLPVGDLIFEHRMYLPLAAVVALVTVGGTELARRLWSTRPQTRKMLAWIVSGAVTLLLVILTIRRNEDYSSELAIWRDTVARCPNNPRAHNYLGLALVGAGNVQEAIGHLEQALRINPCYAEAHNNLGFALWRGNKAREAILHFEQALKIEPDFAKAHNNLGIALARLGQLPEAMEHFEQALRINPCYAEAHYNLGVTLEHLGQVREAIGHLEQALRLKPDFAEAQNRLARLRPAR